MIATEAKPATSVFPVLRKSGNPGKQFFPCTQGNPKQLENDFFVPRVLGESGNRGKRLFLAPPLYLGKSGYIGKTIFFPVLRDIQKSSETTCFFLYLGKCVESWQTTFCPELMEIRKW